MRIHGWRHAAAGTLVVVMVCALLISGCSANEISPSCQSAAEAVVLSQTNLPYLTNITSADEGFPSWLETAYKIDPATVVDGSVYYTDGTVADEIAVLRFASSSDARKGAKALEQYIADRRDVFSGYAPDAEQMLSESLVLTHGDYAALLVCPSPAAAELAFEHSFSADAAGAAPAADESGAPAETSSPTARQTESRTTEPAAEDSGPAADAYDHDAVLAAYQSGDPTSLSAQNRAVYDTAVALLQSITTEDMLPYEKEMAVHDRLIDIIEYDPLALARDSADAAPPESSTPYGALVLGQAICYGYSSSFQLLMDMLGIECITIDGTINDDNDPHSWNMVNLDGDWYLVDVGWDDPLNSPMTYTYFNRSEEEFNGYNRKWDRRGNPQATGGRWSGENALLA